MDLPNDVLTCLSDLDAAPHEKAYLIRALARILDAETPDLSKSVFDKLLGRSQSTVIRAAGQAGGVLEQQDIIVFEGLGKEKRVALTDVGRGLIEAFRDGRIGLREGAVEALSEGDRDDWTISLDGPLPWDPTEADWFPPPSLWQSSNLQKTLNHFDVPTHGHLRKRSLEDRETFMAEMCDILDLEFSREPDTYVDASRGAAFARFFEGGFLSAYRNCVERHLDDRGDEVALRYEREDGAIRTWTFSELDAAIQRTALMLLDRGLEAGDVVALQMPNTLEAAAAFFACMLNRYAVVPLYEVAGVRDVAERLAISQTKAVITADVGRFAGKDRPISSLTNKAVSLAETDYDHAVDHLVIWCYGEDLPNHWDDRCVDWKAETQRLADSTRHKRVAVTAGPSDEVALIGFSSGSTGTPKGLQLSQTCMTYNFAKEAYLYADIRAGDVGFWLTRPAWVMWYWTLVGALANGATFLAYEGSPAANRDDAPDDMESAGRVLDLADRHRITMLGSIASNCSQLATLSTREIDRYDLSRLRTIGSTAEAITQDGWEAIAFSVGRGRVHPMSFIGGTDRGALNNSPAMTTSQQARSVGGWVVECDGILVDAEGNEQKLEGEVAIRGPYPGQAQGLIGDPDGRQYLAKLYRPRDWTDLHTAEDIDPEDTTPEENNVWYHGDGYRRQNTIGGDERIQRTEPRYEALGRVGTDRFKCGGVWVEPVRVEGSVEGIPFVSDSMALEVPGGPKGWVLFVQPADAEGREAPELSADQKSTVRHAVAEVAAKTTLPDAIISVPAIPRNIAQKKMHAVVRKLARGKSADELPIGGMSHSERWVIDRFEEAIRTHQESVTD